VQAETEVLVGLGLFVASELIGMSRLKSNSVLQLVLMTAQRAFPYELKRKELEQEAEAPVRRTTTRRRRQ
jgi:hypothetical protein